MWDGSERRNGERRSPRPHKAQLKLCHEQIAVARHALPHQYCSLRDVSWCIEDDMYVCELHLVANHQGHRTLVE